MATFQASYHGIGEMIRSSFMLGEMARRGSNIMSVAIATAPVGDPVVDEHPGRYKASFSMELDRRGGSERDRACATVRNTAPEAFYVEYGNPGAEPYHTLFHAMMFGGAM